MPHHAPSAQEPVPNDPLDYHDGVLTVTFPAQLDVHAMAALWAPCMAMLASHKPKHLQLDAANVSYCDGAGAELLAALVAKQAAHDGSYDIADLLPEGQDLLAFITKLPAPKRVVKTKKVSPVVRAGQAASVVYGLFVQWLVFVGQVMVALGRFCRQPRRLPWRDTWSVVSTVGPDAWFIVVLMGVLFGLILGFQSLIALRQFGAQIFVADLVGVSMTRELAPLMTAVVLIGRSGSAFAAELGGMSINQEVDALRAMAIDPIRFLVVPRVLAATFMMPWMTMLLLFSSLVGCAVVMKLLGYSLALYMVQLQHAVSLSDLWTGMLKTILFGFVVAVIGCQWGLSTRPGAAAVGHVTTGAVVSGIVAVVVIDGICGTIYYYLGV